MTKNQIDYLNYQENVRHNATVENEGIRHNFEQEAVGYQQAAAAGANAQASYLNALTNQQTFQLKRDQWENPFGGGAVSKAIENMGNVGQFIVGGVRFLQSVMK